MRGKHDGLSVTGETAGITPAGAGKTIGGNCGACAGQDHPRRCGENVFLNFCLDLDAGITPAGAGKTVYCWTAGTAPTDHPRRCGENCPITQPRYSGRGSPPQVRGKHYNRDCGSRAYGITPAGAGKTRIGNAVFSVPEDHPRRCGENIITGSSTSISPGSPPQVRGKRIGFRQYRATFGITPAGAGKTLKRSFRNQPFCSRAVQISFNFSNSLNVSLQSGSAR